MPAVDTQCYSDPHDWNFHFGYPVLGPQFVYTPALFSIKYRILELPVTLTDFTILNLRLNSCSKVSIL